MCPHFAGGGVWVTPVQFMDCGKCCLQRRHHFIHFIVQSFSRCHQVSLPPVTSVHSITVSGRNGDDQGQTLHPPWSANNAVHPSSHGRQARAARESVCLSSLLSSSWGLLQTTSANLVATESSSEPLAEPGSWTW